MRGVMIQGTASDVGKTLFLTALCRILANEGYHVAPFKSQNMSNHTYITKDGLEIAKAQALQAKAAKIEPTVWMSPIILKPGTDVQSEVVMLGEPAGFVSGRKYRDTYYEQGLDVITKSLSMLDDSFDFIIMEGAGSPVEVNLKDKELVNMKVAELADVPVILVADINRGGVFASIVGTLELLTTSERQRVKGIVVNKFRGDISMFEDGVKWIEDKVNIPVLGVIPYLDHHLEAEDSLSEQTMQEDGIANQTTVEEDFDDLAEKVKQSIDMEEIKKIIEQWGSV